MFKIRLQSQLLQKVRLFGLFSTTVLFQARVSSFFMKIYNGNVQMTFFLLVFKNMQL